MKINLNSYIKCKDHDGYKAIEIKEFQWMLYYTKSNLSS